MNATESIARAIAAATGRRFKPDDSRQVAGGSINRTLTLAQGKRRYFVKLNRAHRQSMFAAESAGLKALAETETVRVPEAICYGAAGGQAFLVLEYLWLGPGTTAAAAKLGRRLARLHRNTRDRFGWERANTLGTTPQPNDWHEDWIAFLRKQRLGYQLSLLGDSELSRLGERLLDTLPACFDDYQPRPSLIHGDLWGGNWSSVDGDEPVIYDPACYYADREMEIAMTELFGGFPAAFYQAYNETWPLDAGYAVRKHLYLLYHVLNHANLFGGGYRAQAAGIMQRLLQGSRRP